MFEDLAYKTFYGEDAALDLLGAVLVRPALFPDLSALLDPAGFSLEHQPIWQSFLDLHKRSLPITLPAVARLLAEREQLEAACGLPTFYELVADFHERCPSVAASSRCASASSSPLPTNASPPPMRSTACAASWPPLASSPPMRTGAAFVVVHHFNKSSAFTSQAPTAGMTRVRGSSDIAAAVDAALSVTLSGSRRATTRLITPEKNRELPEEPALEFSILSHGEDALVLDFTSTETSDPVAVALSAGHQFSPFVLNRLFAALPSFPGVQSSRQGRFKTYESLA